jgi:hypothetical protein
MSFHARSDATSNPHQFRGRTVSLTYHEATDAQLNCRLVRNIASSKFSARIRAMSELSTRRATSQDNVWSKHGGHNAGMRAPSFSITKVLEKICLV